MTDALGLPLDARRIPTGEARVVERADHPFFVGTLFVSSMISSPESPHPLIVALLRASSVR